MLRTTGQSFAVFLFTVMLLCGAQQWPVTAQSTSGKPGATMLRRNLASQKQRNAIALAMSAGPPAISRRASIIGCVGGSCADMNELAKGPTKELRTGTNGWVCYPLKDGPMCLDKQWRKWMEGWMSKSDPHIEGTGIGYMLRGDTGSSNTDPFAMAPTKDNQWVVAPPHIMVLYQDPKMLDAFPTDPKTGGPWVMWKGTPYAHVMVPVSPMKKANRSVR